MTSIDKLRTNKQNTRAHAHTHHVYAQASGTYVKAHRTKTYFGLLLCIHDVYAHGQGNICEGPRGKNLLFAVIRGLALHLDAPMLIASEHHIERRSCASATQASVKVSACAPASGVQTIGRGRVRATLCWEEVELFVGTAINCWLSTTAWTTRVVTHTQSQGAQQPAERHLTHLGGGGCRSEGATPGHPNHDLNRKASE